MLGTTPDGDHVHRTFLENQIHEFDARNEVLYEQLDRIETSQTIQKRNIDLKLVAQDLLEDAMKKNTQATLILDSLQVGPKSHEELPREALVEPDAGGRGDAETDEVDLFVENIRLRAEVKSLQTQVADLKALVRKLKSQ